MFEPETAQCLVIGPSERGEHSADATASESSAFFSRHSIDAVVALGERAKGGVHGPELIAQLRGTVVQAGQRCPPGGAGLINADELALKPFKRTLHVIRCRVRLSEGGPADGTRMLRRVIIRLAGAAGQEVEAGEAADLCPDSSLVVGFAVERLKEQLPFGCKAPQFVAQAALLAR